MSRDLCKVSLSLTSYYHDLSRNIAVEVDQTPSAKHIHYGNVPNKAWIVYTLQFISKGFSIKY